MVNTTAPKNTTFLCNYHFTTFKVVFYHAFGLTVFGINERMSFSKIGHIKAKLSGVEYVFFDEVSMLSA